MRMGSPLLLDMAKWSFSTATRHRAAISRGRSALSAARCAHAFLPRRGRLLPSGGPIHEQVARLHMILYGAHGSFWHGDAATDMRKPESTVADSAAGNRSKGGAESGLARWRSGGRNAVEMLREATTEDLQERRLLGSMAGSRLKRLGSLVTLL